MAHHDITLLSLHSLWNIILRVRIILLTSSPAHPHPRQAPFSRHFFDLFLICVVSYFKVTLKVKKFGVSLVAYVEFSTWFFDWIFINFAQCDCFMFNRKAEGGRSGGGRSPFALAKWGGLGRARGCGVYCKQIELNAAQLAMCMRCARVTQSWTSPQLVYTHNTHTTHTR